MLSLFLVQVAIRKFKDGKYWAFYVNGEYAVSGVDTTEITEGGLYEFRAE